MNSFLCRVVLCLLPCSECLVSNKIKTKNLKKREKKKRKEKKEETGVENKVVAMVGWHQIAEQ